VTLSPREADALLKAHGLTPSRALGQNFVVDPNTVRRIARLAGVGPGDHVIEVGPGLGSLTRALVETGASVTALELDRHLLPILGTELVPLGVRVVQGDAMEANWTALLAASDRWVLVANLPYNVATPLVLDLLDDVPAIAEMVVMVQREAGERLAAAPGGSAYGIPSVKVAYWATAAVVARVPPTVFLPQPKVESVVVRLRRRQAPAVDADPAVLFALVRTAFGQRRKMLRRSLADLLGGADAAVELITAAGLDPTARPETLSIEAWGALAQALASR
jgi:16S rRNA (adenine1518-N6/adenine1519-N6)-dimethyltransferase